MYAVITDGAGNQQGRYSTGPVNVPAYPAGLHTDSNQNGLPDQWEAHYGVTNPNGEKGACASTCFTRSVRAPRLPSVFTGCTATSPEP